MTAYIVPNLGSYITNKKASPETVAVGLTQNSTV